MKKIIGVIPARYKSTRFPGKPLVPLLGKPMILWVAEQSSKALGKENVYIATDDERISRAVKESGFNVVMTSSEHQTGTDRIYEVAQNISADIYVNIQGDEPTILPESITQIVQGKLNQPDFVINGMAKLSKSQSPVDVNIPKVLVNENNELIYMSRNAIPGFKVESNKPEHYFKQVCIYAYSPLELSKFGCFGRKSTIEYIEDIEILRFLELGVKVKMVEVPSEVYAVDIVEDVNIVESKLKVIQGWE